MCGIVGATAQRDVVPILMAGIEALEYRGYDSAGICTVHDGALSRQRTAGKVQALKDLLTDNPMQAHSGISHTRWATHGEPTTRNAHPHISADRVALVHNGIIENHEPLREALQAQGFTFDTDTDTEVVAHLIEAGLKEGQDFPTAFHAAVDQLEGAFAIAAVCADAPGIVCAARQGSPLLVGLGIGENFVGSDVQALIAVTNRFIYLEDGDRVVVRRDSIEITDRKGNAVTREQHTSDFNPERVSRGRYRHFMLKEIFEQSAAISETLEGRIHHGKLLPQVFGPGSDDVLKQADHIHIVACGTSYHAGLVAKYWIESYARIPCQVEIASEYRYRDPVVPKNTLFVTISQSGETADTLSALRMAKALSYKATLAICNVASSSLVRESDHTLLTRAGPEIGVASTKAFTTQLTALALFALHMSRAQGMDSAEHQTLVQDLEKAPKAVQQALRLDDTVRKIAERFADKHHALFLGRGRHFPIALEGALKLKEISYIHAEAYPAGELKHGPLALVDEDMPVIAVAPNDALLEKLKSNIEEVRARGGELFVVADADVAATMHGDRHLMELTPMPELITPLVYTIPLQLLAYHVAVLKGTDVDQPRNLAKSVTVE